MTVITSQLQEQIENMLEEKDFYGLKTLLSSVDDGQELLHAINELSRKEKVIVFRLLQKDMALEIFEQLETVLQKELLESFTDEKAREFIEELDPDDRVTLLDEMPAKVAKRLMQLLSTEDRKVTHMLMGYEPETAGRIMTPEFITLKRDMLVNEALLRIRKEAIDKETIYTLYVTDAKRKLEGVLPLRKLLLAESDAKIGDIMYDAVVKVATDTDQEEVAKAIKDYDVLAIPVVDKEGRIVGIVTVDDAMDILEQEATDDIYTQAGLADITGKETNRSEVLVRGSLWAIWKVRMPFLVLALLGGLAAALVLEGFEDTLEYVLAAAFFIPVIMDMGGSVGTQSTTVFTRGVVLGQIEMKRFWKHLGKETLVGLSLGLIFGAVAGLIAGVWQGMALGLAVGSALAITVTLASFLGFIIPFALMKMKLDQAAGSAPIITTLKDILGLLVYFLLVMAFVGI